MPDEEKSYWSIRWTTKGKGDATMRVCNLCRSDYVNAPKVEIKVLAKIPVKLLRDEDARAAFWQEFDDSLFSEDRLDRMVGAETVGRLYRQVARQVPGPALSGIALHLRSLGWGAQALAELVEESTNDADGK